MASQYILKLFFVFGTAVTVAASPSLFEEQNDNCKKAGQLDGNGNLACDDDLPCPNTGEVCKPTKWHENVQDPWIKYCSCTVSGEFSGPDPTTGLCMAYIVQNGADWVERCSTGNCQTPDTCQKEAAGAWKKCICRH